MRMRPSWKALLEISLLCPVASAVAGTNAGGWLALHTESNMVYTDTDFAPCDSVVNVSSCSEVVPMGWMSDGQAQPDPFPAVRDG